MIYDLEGYVDDDEMYILFFTLFALALDDTEST